MLQVLNRPKRATLEQLAHQNAPPDFNLIEPRRMLGCIVKHNPMTRITQKRGTRLPIFQNAVFAFLTQVDSEVRQGRNKVHQRCRTVGIEVVHHHVPTRGLGVRRHQGLNMGQKVCLCTSGTTRGHQNLTAHHIARDDKRPGSMPNVFKLPTLHLPWSQWQSRVFALQSLYAGQFVRTADTLASGGQYWSLLIERADVVHLDIKILFPTRGQPLRVGLRLKFPFFPSLPDCRVEISSTFHRATPPPPTSLPVLCLMGLPRSLA